MKASSFALIAGIVYLALGILGLIPAALVPPPIDAPPTRFALFYGYLLGLFPVNILHTMLNIAVGALGLAAWSGRMSSIMYARALAWCFGVLAVMGMLPMSNTTFGLMPLHAHDIWLHAITALAAAYVGWREPAAARERRRAAGDRRQRMMPVTQERRFGLADRRERFGTMSAA
ncbi:MAG TPA: DUF4383 domain-containing protein [Burkholderiales bacterium]|nr:DUF4383 domain-containing protein [Burkholderiales bacterium]